MSEEGVSARLQKISERISSACARAGRAESDVQLVAVSKRQPVELIEAAQRSGQLHFGESRLQEALRKVETFPALSWHMVGPIQSNKAKAIARTFAVVHSVDRRKVAEILSGESVRLGKRLPVFVQVNLGREPGKKGFAPDVLEESVRPLGSLKGLNIRGLMAIPPNEGSAEAARKWFRRLRECRDAIRQWGDWPDFAGHLSMGMSGDFEVAVEEGATHIRLGTELFGPRSSS